MRPTSSPVLHVGDVARDPDNLSDWDLRLSGLVDTPTRATTEVQLMAYSVHDFREQVLGSARAAGNGQPPVAPNVT